jgi:hypothetical protein
MSAGEKAAISHRGRALRAFVQYFRDTCRPSDAGARATALEP